MQLLSPQLARKKLESEAASVCFIDVRSEDEFKSGHLPGATCVPLDRIESGAAEIPRDKLVILNCQGGIRSAKAFKLLQKRGYGNLAELEGGFSAWAALGFPVNRTRAALPIMRQVLLTAGTLVVTGSLLALVVNVKFLFLPLFVGAGLTFAGATGWCGMAMLLEKMPWNKG
jgi:rhodanese-related sulfurtransferase